MPLDLELKALDGKLEHVKRGTTEIFKGHVSRDLEIGDMFEQPNKEGFVRKMKVKEKQVTQDGYIIVASEEVIV
jgi:hypothetical protein